MRPHTEVRSLLEETRKAAHLTQEEVAKRMGLHQSRVSRLESGDSEPATADYVAYLKAVGTDRARKLRTAIETAWKHLPQPPLRHPELLTLMEAESALERLEVFKGGASIPHVLAGQAELLFRRLYEFAEFLLNLDHRIVYVGEIGVGKTTAACKQAGLVTNTDSPEDLKGMMLDTGGGRTTLCDVHVRAGDRFSLEVEPLPDEEIYRLVDEFCRSVVAKGDQSTPASRSADFKLPEEVERALRVMAKLPRPVRRKAGPQDPDPASVFAEKHSLSDFKAETASRLTLWRRTRRLIDFEGSDQVAGRQWLRDTFTKINNGRHEDFSLPARIIVTVPFDPVPGSPYKLTLLDTRGVDGSAIRPDILAQLKNPRALTVLCAKWGSAPDPSIHELLKYARETEVDPTLLGRVAILVIARAGDALAMRHDSGESAQDAPEGYEIKRAHVEDALHRIGMNGIAVEVFDAATDPAAGITQFLLTKISDLRAAQTANAHATISAIDEMLSNVEKAQALATLKAINDDLRIFADAHARLKATQKPVQTRLVEAVRSTLHPRTVWAATRRSGEFWNFDVYQYLGDGASSEAKRRCAAPIDGLREIISNRLANSKYEAAHGLLGQLLDNVSVWESDFVKAARHHALAIFKPKLASAQELWTRTEGKYGFGPGYRDDVACELEAWFDANADLQDAFEKQLRRAWKTSVLQPLRKASGGIAPAE